MCMQENSAHKSMSWKDHLTSTEKNELLEARNRKVEAIETYNAIWRRLKSRGDARKRRLASKSKNDGNDACPPR